MATYDRQLPIVYNSVRLPGMQAIIAILVFKVSWSYVPTSLQHLRAVVAVVIIKASAAYHFVHQSRWVLHGTHPSVRILSTGEIQLAFLNMHFAADLSIRNNKHATNGWR